MDSLTGNEIPENIKEQIKELGLEVSETEYIPSLNFIRNKLYVGFLFGEGSNAFVENTKRSISYLKQETEKARLSNDLGRYVFLLPRPYRLEGLLDGIELMNVEDEDIGLVVGQVWIDSETPSTNYDAWRYLFEQYGGYAMSKENQDEFNKLPDEITVYRGTTEPEDSGLSWTTNPDIADWFATRFEEYGEVIEKKINKSEVVAFFNDRDESEVILLD